VSISHVENFYEVNNLLAILFEEEEIGQIKLGRNYFSAFNYFLKVFPAEFKREIDILTMSSVQW